MSLPDQMADRWQNRPEPPPGEGVVSWHMLMRDDPEVVDLARQAQQRLAGFDADTDAPLPLPKVRDYRGTTLPFRSSPRPVLARRKNQMLEVEVTEEANDLSHGGGLMPSSYNAPTNSCSRKTQHHGGFGSNRFELWAWSRPG